MKTIKINSNKRRKFILDYWVRLNEEQNKINDGISIVYCKYSLKFIIEQKIYFIDYLFHPNILKKRNYYDDEERINTKEELIKDIAKILEFEITSETHNFLTNKERDNLIKFYKQLNK